MSDGRLKDSRQRAAGVNAVPPHAQIVLADVFPPPAQVVNDDALAQQQQGRKASRWSARNVFWVMLVNVAARGIIGTGWARPLTVFMACFAAWTIADYWVPPRPQVSFLSWMLRVLGVLVNFYVGMVALPLSLRHSLPTPLAYGLPAFLVGLSLYWMPPVFPMKGRTALWKWAVMSAAFAVFWGLVGSQIVT